MSAAAFDFKDQHRREALKSFQSASHAKSAGKGTKATDQILLGVLYDPHLCTRLRARLSKVGIASTAKTRRREIHVFVSRHDRTKAFDTLTEHLQQHPNVRPHRIGRAYDLTFLMVLLGTLLVPVLGLSISWPTAITFWATAVGIAFICSRIVTNWRWYGRYQFSVAEMLLFMAVIAAVIALWRVALVHA